jgi:2-polyprenyl-3-methyl-5-hydroxy-6-metoxy-1,4-benzoquinol methylase
MHISNFFIKRIYADHNLKIIKKFIKKGSLLEIGAGSGSFLIEARKKEFEVCGIELNSILTDFIRNKLKIPCSDSTFDNIYFKDKKFDIIYHCDVISHFYDPIEEFKKLYDNLNDSGFLVFETGNLGDVEKKYYNVFTKFQYPDHLYFFSEENLKELLRLSGFKILKIYRYSILLQLKIIKIQKVLMDFIKNTKSNVTINKNVTLIKYNNTVLMSLIKFIKDINNFFMYIIRYKIGYIGPKKGRPQTVIVIAMKLK